ncbi:patatin-like phospholipase family protein [Patescibacteria group bacterium]|nr:patatin-like phospholipase family protein [Patescibacteria group bacterium]
MQQESRSQKPRIGLALSGGSARGIAHIGVLQALSDHHIPIDCIAGTSSGAIVAAAFAFGYPLPKLQEKAKTLSWYSIANLPTSGLGLTSNQSLGKIMEEFIGGAADIKDAKIPLAIVATDIETGEKVVFRNGNAALAVRASACIPGVFIPVEIEGRKLVDGGLSESLPLSSLQTLQPDIRIGVNAIHWHSTKPVGNLIDVMSNAIDIAANHQKENPLQFADIMIEPDLSDFGPSDFKKTDALIAEGYRAALAQLPAIKELIRQRSPEPSWKRFFRWFKK